MTRLVRTAGLLLAVLLLVVPGGAAEEPAVGWELEATSRIGPDHPAGVEVDWEFSDGILRFSGPLEQRTFVGVTVTIPEGVDLKQYPVLEIEWRSDRPSPGNLLVGPLVEPEAEGGLTLDTYYYTPWGAGAKDQWTTHASRVMPDAGFPTERSATRLTRFMIRGYPWGRNMAATPSRSES